MSRPDISPHLIHFTKPVDDLEMAFRNLQKIISDSKLLGSGKWIKGGTPCVCFTETPAPSIGNNLRNQYGAFRYSPFGIRVMKRWLMDRGGRPVIYQPDSEFQLLSNSHRWRHVRYEVGDDLSEETDFTWEREWRVRCDSLPLDPESAQIVVPHEAWRKRLLREHAGWDESLVMDYAQIVGQVQAESYRSPFPWEVITLESGVVS